MLGEIMNYIHNFFIVDYIAGEFTISSGALSISISSKYIKICGSMLNDGVWKSSDVLEDETFTGEVWLLAPPKEFLALVDEIKAFHEKRKAVSGVFQSENLAGEYSYTLATNGDGSQIDWKGAFRSRLNAWRKL